MVSQTNEQALEATIERALTWLCREDFQPGLVAKLENFVESYSMALGANDSV
jgi:hypothetical protein